MTEECESGSSEEAQEAPDTVTVVVGGRSRSNDNYDPMYSWKILDRALTGFSESHPDAGKHVRKAVEDGRVELPDDTVEAIGSAMKTWFRANTSAFAEGSFDHADPPTKDTWINIADCFIYADPDNERGFWDDYTHAGGPLRM